MTEKDTLPDNGPTNAGSRPNEQSKNLLKLIMIAVTVSLVLAVIGTLALGIFFKKGIERAVDQASNGTVELNDGSTFSTGTDLPEDFPEEVPLFPQGETVASSSQRADDGFNFVVTFSTDASADTVREYYGQTLNEDGWQITSTTTVNDRLALVAERNDLRVSVSIVPGNGETETTYTITADRER